MRGHLFDGALALITASAAPALPAREASVGLLFAYHIDAQAEFDAAYRDHLEWHRKKKDHLSWYGWYVIAGGRTGMFMDGTFGSGFEAIDRRPAIAEDARHFAEGAALHSRPAANSVWQLWPEVSTVFSLEDQHPAPLLQVLELRVEPSRLADFERLLTTLSARRRLTPGLGWTWYRGSAGSVHPAFLIMIPRKSWSEFANGTMTLGAFAEQAYGRLPGKRSVALDKMTALLASEVWRYRADLSYFPGDKP